MILPPNDIYEGSSTPGQNKDEDNFNLPYTIGSSSPPPHTHPKVELTWNVAPAWH